jgi:hypothetical protein
MLFSGLIFIDLFAKSKHKDSALGANLMGALVGGALQSITYVIGIKALLLVVAALYVAALAYSRKETDTANDFDRGDQDEHGSIEERLLNSVVSLQATVREGIQSAGNAPKQPSAAK